MKYKVYILIYFLLFSYSIFEFYKISQLPDCFIEIANKECSKVASAYQVDCTTHDNECPDKMYYGYNRGMFDKWDEIDNNFEWFNCQSYNIPNHEFTQEDRNQCSSEIGKYSEVITNKDLNLFLIISYYGFLGVTGHLINRRSNEE